VDGAAITPAGAPGAADQSAGETDPAKANAGEVKGQTDRKGANRLSATAPFKIPDANAATSSDDSGAPAATASDGTGEHTIQAGSTPADEGKPAHAHANHAADESSAPKNSAVKPSETTPRPQIEAQLAGSTDKPAADAGQLTPQQHPTENVLAPAPAQAGAAAPDQVTVPVAGLAVEIAARAQAGSNRFSIRLDPPELGRIDVRLDVDRDGHVTSHLMVEKAETLDLLRRDAPELERSLQQAGLKTGDNGMQFTLRDQSFGGQNQNPADHSRSGAARLVVPDPAMAPVETVQASYGRSLGLGGGIDIRV
jgi:chemotaxis protein MotD